MRGLALLVLLLGCGPDFTISDGARSDGDLAETGGDSRSRDAARVDGGACTTALGCAAGSCDALFTSVLIDEPFESGAHVSADWRMDFDTVLIEDGAAKFGPHSPPRTRYTLLLSRTSFPDTITVCAEMRMPAGTNASLTNVAGVGIRGNLEGVVLNLRATELRIELNGLGDTPMLLDRREPVWPSDDRFTVLLDRVGDRYVAEVRYGDSVSVLRGSYVSPSASSVTLEASVLESAVFYDRVVVGRVTSATRALLDE